MGIPKLRAMGFGKPFGEGFAKGYTFEPTPKGVNPGETVVGSQFAPSAIFNRAPASAYDQLSEVGRIGFASGRIARDAIGLGTRSRLFFNSHPLDFSQGTTYRMLREKGAPSWYGQTGGAAVGFAVGVGSGNLDLTNPGQAGRPKEYQAVFPVGQDGEESKQGKYGAAGEWFGRGFLGQTGKLLPYEDLQQVRPDITSDQYDALKKQQFDRDLIGGSAGTVPYVQVLGGAFKFTPYNPISQQPELTSLGYRVPATAIALGAATAYGSVRLADKLFNKPTEATTPPPVATPQQKPKTPRSAPASTPGNTPPVTPPPQPAPQPTGLNTAQLNKSYGDAFSRVQTAIPQKYRNAANIEKFLASDPAFSQADTLTRQAVASQFEQKLGTTGTGGSSVGSRSNSLSMGDYNIIGGRKSLRDRLSGGMGSFDGMTRDQGVTPGSGGVPQEIKTKVVDYLVNKTSDFVQSPERKTWVRLPTKSGEDAAAVYLRKGQQLGSPSIEIANINFQDRLRGAGIGGNYLESLRQKFPDRTVFIEQAQSRWGERLVKDGWQKVPDFAPGNENYYKPPLASGTSAKTQTAFRSPNFEYGVVGGRQSLRDRLSGGMGSFGRMEMARVAPNGGSPVRPIPDADVRFETARRIVDSAMADPSKPVNIAGKTVIPSNVDDLYKMLGRDLKLSSTQVAQVAQERLRVKSGAIQDPGVGTIYPNPKGKPGATKPPKVVATAQPAQPLAIAEFQTTTETPNRGLPRKLQAKLDSIKANSVGLDRAMAIDLTASQIAVNEIQGTPGYKPEVQSVQSTYQKPIGSGRQRINQLMSDLKSNVAAVDQLSQATGKMAQFAVDQMGQQPTAEPAIKPRLGGGTRTVQGEALTLPASSPAQLPPAQTVSDATYTPPNPVRRRTGGGPAIEGEMTRPASVSETQWNGANMYQKKQLVKQSMAAPTVSAQPSVADMQAAQKAAIARLRGTTSVSIGDGVTVQTPSPRVTTSGTVSIGDGVRAKLSQPVAAPSPDVAMNRTYSGLQQPYTPKAQPQSTLLKSPGDYSIRTKIADLRKPPLEGDYQKVGSRSYIGAGGDRVPDVKYQMSPDRLTPEQYTRRLQVNEALRGNSNAGVMGAGSGVTMPGGRGITTAVPKGRPQSAPAPVIPYTPQQPVAASQPTVKVARPASGSTAIVPYQAASRGVATVSPPSGTNTLNVGKMTPTRPAEAPVKAGFKLPKVSGAGAALGGALTAYAAASEYGRARSEGSGQVESLARAGVGVAVGVPQFLAGAAAQSITDTVRGVGGIAKQLSGAPVSELKKYDAETRRVKEQVAQRTEDIPKAIVQGVGNIANNAYSAITGKGPGVPDQKQLQAVGDKAANKLLEASAKYRIVKQADGSFKSVPNTPGGETRGQVTRVLDGDTVEVKRFNPQTNKMEQSRIRVANLNAPEKNTSAGPAATKSMEQKASVGSVVSMRGQGTDKYGRSLRQLAGENSGAQDIGEKMIQEGTAKRYTGKTTYTNQVSNQPAPQQQNQGPTIPQAFIPGSEEFNKLDKFQKTRALQSYGANINTRTREAGANQRNQATNETRLKVADMQYGKGGQGDRNNQTKTKIAEMQYGKGGQGDRNNQSKEKIADVTSGRRLQGTVYTADKRLEGTKYTADKRLQGTVYTADKRYQGTVYTADQRLKGTVYTADKRLQGQDLVSGRKLQGDVYKADKSYDAKVDSAIVTGDYKVKVANTQGQFKLGAEDIKGQYGVAKEQVKGDTAVKVAEIKASGGDGGAAAAKVFESGSKQLGDVIKMFSTDQTARRKQQTEYAKIFAASSRR